MPDREVNLQGRMAQVLPFPARPRPRAEPPQDAAEASLPAAYAELHCLSAFSFQRGASMPDELVAMAYNLGYQALAITDECSVAGVVRAMVGLRDHEAAIRKLEKEKPGSAPPLRKDFRLLYGSEFTFDGFRLVALARNIEGWGDLCEFISAARMPPAVKGEYIVSLERSDFGLLRGCELLYVPQRLPGIADAAALLADIARFRAVWDEAFWIAVELPQWQDDDLWLATLQQVSDQTGMPLVATSDVHMHHPARKRLQDVMTAIHQGRTVAECGFALQSNSERCLRSMERLELLFPPELLANTLVVVQRCKFKLEEVKPRYEYPMENVPNGEMPMDTLTRLTWEGSRKRYPEGVSPAVCAQIVHELTIISDLGYAMFFLTVADIVRFAEDKKILCQGRGSAANSTVCYCLGITALRPEGKANMLFERFVSRERREPPDIDVDFEHQRREEVIQYIYKKYGRERSAIAAVVICYRSRSALRDVGKTLGIDARLVDEFAKDHYWFDETVLVDRLEQACERVGVREDPRRLAQWLDLTAQLRGFPRHLSQHVGGFVLTQDKLIRLVPVENASMENRSIVQWEKRDLEEMNMIKVDVLALGMLSAIRRCLDFVNRWRGTNYEMHTLEPEDPLVYDMICQADTVGVFQIESRAQMSMLPRLRPREYYDLVVEVAIVRPGPILGGMVHPYLKQREKLAKLREGETLEYEYPALNDAVERTLGVPIFQEQVMQIAMLGAGFSADQADRLRRSMAAWKRSAGIHLFKDDLVNGLLKNGYSQDFADRIFKQIQGFGEYGFPESHAASFAKLVYVSSWLKCHEPACFLAALLDAQPMGFYSGSQLVQDAVRHGVEVRPVDVTVSGWDSTLEARPEGKKPPVPFQETRKGPGAYPAAACWPGTNVPHPQRLPQPAVRLGLRRVGSLSEEGARRLLAARAEAPFTSTEDLALRARLEPADMKALAAADALQSLSGHRRQQVWEATAQRSAPGLLRGVPIHEPPLVLEAGSEEEEVVGDYASLGLTLRRHPLALLRPELAEMGARTARQLATLPHGREAHACGIVSMRQRPPTAKGTLFVTLEDETGIVNVIVWEHVVEQFRDALLKSRLLSVQGVWQRDTDSGGRVRHLLARSARNLTPLLGRLGTVKSRDFH
jgi:error-prone DNA polymerase